jgi:hypothetical protein
MAFFAPEPRTVLQQRQPREKKCKRILDASLTCRITRAVLELDSGAMDQPEPFFFSDAPRSSVAVTCAMVIISALRSP